MKHLKTFLGGIMAAILVGCVAVHNTTKEVGKDGIGKKTSSNAIGFGDARAALASVKNGIGTSGSNSFSGTAASGLDASTSASNVAPTIESIMSGLMQGAVKAAAAAK